MTTSRPAPGAPRPEGRRPASCVALAALFLPWLSTAHGATPVLVEARAVDRLGDLGITLDADGALWDPGADPRLAAGAFMAGDRLVIDATGLPRPAQSVAFDPAASLGTSAVRTTPTPAGTAFTVVPGGSGASLLLPGAAEAFLARAGRWTAITDAPERLLDVFPSDVDGDGVPDRADAFPLDPAAWVDGDGDGAPDAWNPGRDGGDSTTGLLLDAFPADAAASVDSDGDGYPDAWNPGAGPEDSTTGLVLDAFPDDPTRWAVTVTPVPGLPGALGAALAALLLLLGVRRVRSPGPRGG